MKGSDACQIYSLKALSETGAVFSGVNYLIDKHVITKDVDYCISTDSGIEALHIASLGDAEYFITVKGRAAHSGRGWTGVNAIEYGASLIEELKKLGVQISKRRSRIDAEPVYGTRKMRPGLYVNTAKGGLKGNIIPDTFEILVDRRFIPEEKAGQVQKEVERVVRDFGAKHGEVKVSMKPILGYDPMLTPPDHSLVKTVRRVARKILGKDVPPCGSQGATDVSAVTALGVPVAVLGTTRESSNIHGIDEN